MSKAIQHALPLRYFRCSGTVIFLIEKKSRFLSVYIVNMISDPVLANYSIAVGFGKLVFPVKAGAAIHSLKLSELHIIALINRADLLSESAEITNRCRKNDILQTLHSERKNLYRQNIIESVNRKSGKAVCLPKDKTAAFEILTGHYRHTVVDGIPDSTLPKFLIESVVRIAGNKSYPDF